MTTEELLRPKYEIVGDYPGNDFAIGTVLYKHSKIPDWVQIIESDVYLSRGIKESVVLKYPNLFVKLRWWDKLTNDNFPEYVKKGPSSLVRKVKEYHPRIEWMEFEGGIKRKIKAEWKPATKEEWDLQQLNNTNE